jgi:putative spermidine/putrescine transport system ATP-binding protein
VIPSTATKIGDGLQVTLGGATLWATAVDATDGKCLIAIRPEDLTPMPNGPISAIVQTAEYRGRDFYGVATTQEGIELFFRSEHRVLAGETLQLSVEPSRVLVYRP